jgi:hypothetical protein
VDNTAQVNGRETVVNQGLVNVLTGQAACAGKGNGQPISLRHRSVLDDCTTWTLVGDRTANCAIRPCYSTAQNLNVFGNGPYRPGNAVGTWTWSKGAPNETWQLVECPR